MVPTAVGQAEDQTIVRDPVVVTASLPRFLAPGDESRLLLEIQHTEGPTGRMGLDVSGTGLTLGGTIPSGLELGEQEKPRSACPSPRATWATPPCASPSPRPMASN